MARFVGNASPSKKEVHDTFNRNNNCQLNEIRQPVTFNPDTLEAARRQGYDNCAYCIGNSLR